MLPECSVVHAALMPSIQLDPGCSPVQSAWQILSFSLAHEGIGRGRWQDDSKPYTYLEVEK